MMDFDFRALTLLTQRYTKLSTTRLVASSKVLHSAIPTHNCDIIMTLPAKTDDVILMWLLARLRSRSPQIHVHVRHWKNTGMYAFYMTANYENLLHGAEVLGIRKVLKSEFGGGKREFMFEDQLCYHGIEDEDSFLTSEERQSIVYHYLLNLRACPGETLGKVKFLEGQAIVPLLESKKIVSQVFPLHETAVLDKLTKTWVQSVFNFQPLDKICEYFSVKVSMYFAYLGHYTLALTAPTLLGIIFWFIQSNNQLMEDVCFVTFALFNVFWASVYTEQWRRRSAALAYKWGTLDKKNELLQDPRPLYTGYLVTSPVTGRQEPHYPSWKRHLFRYCVTVPVILFCLNIVFCVMLLIFELQEWVNGLVKSEDIPAFCQFLPKILLAVCIGILDEIYKKIATWLNDRENYRMDEAYENNLIIKLVLFQFVNSFLSLFYIAFYLQDMDRLRDQLATLMITRQVIGNIREALVPYVLWKMKLMKVGYNITGHMSPDTLKKEIKGLGLSGSCDSDNENNEETDNISTGLTPDGAPDVSEEPVCTRQVFSEECSSKDCSSPEKVPVDQNSELTLTQAEIESTMKKYEDTFDDYLEMFIQYGYVILFSSAFPLAALFALLNNVIEIRSDAFKLCIYHQRPFGKRVRNIGIWQDALRVMGLIAVVVNSALIGVSGQMTRMTPDLDTTSRIFVILALEHVILVLKMLFTYAIPSQPQWISQEVARLEFQRREALKSVESHLSSPDVRVGHSPTKVSSPICNPARGFSTPSIPARHHSSDLTLLSQEPCLSLQNKQSLTQTQSLLTGADNLDTKKYSTVTALKPEQLSLFSQNPSSISVPSDSNTDSLSAVVNTSSKQVQSFMSLQKSENQTSTQVYDKSGSRNVLRTTIPVLEMKENITVIRPWDGYSLTEQEARMQTRQRILQSAKLRQEEEAKLIQRKSASNL
ncbi:anoctamin-8-like isoform X2 [Ruditapes philippinarum]|uniref:anoctamin-8-like isoform X2 n=1 Tax=Ruditapes philippinarum TaxID=129788 RepID=UPI00295BEEB3|nr:anoctamin-8-like isoform X2 [Ruditapes philippinarum]